MKRFCFTFYALHIDKLHNADYEVCRNFWCGLAYWLERTFDVFGKQTI